MKKVYKLVLGNIKNEENLNTFLNEVNNCEFCNKGSFSFNTKAFSYEHVSECGISVIESEGEDCSIDKMKEFVNCEFCHGECDFINMEEISEIELQFSVRHNQHQGIPTFQFLAHTWEEANLEFLKGIKRVKEENEKHIQSYEGYNALISGIVDFTLISTNGIEKGQFGFSIDTEKNAKELVNWYLNL